MAGKKAKKPATKSPKSKPKSALAKLASKVKAKLTAKPAKAAKPEKPAKAEKPAKVEKAAKADKAAKAEASPAKPEVVLRREPKQKAEKPRYVEPPPKKENAVFLGPMPDKPLPRATKLPPQGEPLTKREMEQILTVGVRGVEGEGSLKGRLFVHLGFPYLEVIGRDKREILFLLQGPDQEVLPAYIDHKVSVNGFIRRLNNHGGTVDVRKYAAKKPDEVVEAPAVVEDKLRYLSPGEVEQVCSPGMAGGIRGFATVRGRLEMTGEDFFLVVSNGGTRSQVSFLLQGKAAKGIKKHLGQTMQVIGVLEKTSGWGGTIQCENAEARATDFPPVSRSAMQVVNVEAKGDKAAVEVKLNGGLSIRLPEKPGFTWAVEPTIAKRVSLREANFEIKGSGPATREFFFTPRNPGLHEVEFFLAKAFNPAQVSKSYRLSVTVKPPEMNPS